MDTFLSITFIFWSSILKKSASLAAVHESDTMQIFLFLNLNIIFLLKKSPQRKFKIKICIKNVAPKIAKKTKKILVSVPPCRKIEK